MPKLPSVVLAEVNVHRVERSLWRFQWKFAKPLFVECCGTAKKQVVRVPDFAAELRGPTPTAIVGDCPIARSDTVQHAEVCCHGARGAQRPHLSAGRADGRVLRA